MQSPRQNLKPFFLFLLLPSNNLNVSVLIGNQAFKRMTSLFSLSVLSIRRKERLSFPTDFPPLLGYFHHHLYNSPQLLFS